MGIIAQGERVNTSAHPTGGKNGRSGVTAPGNITITGINTDKTRRMAGSETVYHVCFVLSEKPAGTWRDIFSDKWKTFGTTTAGLKNSAGVDGGFLFVECSLGEVHALLQALKVTVSATNDDHRKFLERQDEEQKRKEESWKEERMVVEEMVRLLHF